MSKPGALMIQLRYLPANMAWCFTFGLHVETAQIIPIHPDAKRTFSDKSEALYEARFAGFTVDEKGTVH